MDNLQQFIDLHRQDIEPGMFTIALAIRYIRVLINHGGSDIGCPDDDSALHPHHLEAFVARAIERTWEDSRVTQEWHRIQQMLPQVKKAWEQGQKLFLEAFDQAKSNQENMEYLSQIDFAVDCYAYVSASRAYPDSPAFRDWAINGYMLLWRGTFLKDQDGEEYMEGRM